MNPEISVIYEATPNPNTYKFIINKHIAGESLEFDDPAQTQRSPLAHKLFGFPWADKVFIGCDFVSITKQSWVEWAILADPLSQLIKEHIENGDPVLVEGLTENSHAHSEDSDVVRTIKQIIDSEIRPAVAMDGGDIVFEKYEDNIVYVHMRGACSGCPSATMTLKQGIETRLVEAVPEIKEVVSL